VREEGIILKHHSRASACRGQVVDRLPAKHDLAIGDPLMAGDHAQRRGLPAAAWLQETAIRPLGHGEIDGINRHDRSITLCHRRERDVGRINHGSVLLQSAAAMPPPGLTNLPSADATDRSTPDAEVSVSQILEHHALGIEE
jgi:hypothetical protein